MQDMPSAYSTSSPGTHFGTVTRVPSQRCSLCSLLLHPGLPLSYRACSVKSRCSGNTLGLGGAQRIPQVKVPPPCPQADHSRRHSACFSMYSQARAPVAHKSNLDSTSCTVFSSFQTHSLCSLHPLSGITSK